jgi:DNA invertase Pin-like site-specific DNA recombinase
MTPNKQRRCAVYDRYSTDRQTENSSDGQVRVCKMFAERMGFKIVGYYSDPARSGGTAQRPQYQRMLEDARAGKFDTIIAEDMKRLWREQAEQWRCIKELMKLKVRIMTVSGIDSSAPGFDLIAAVQGAAGEMERREAAYRTRRGQAMKVEKGGHGGGRTFGYTPESKMPGFDPLKPPPVMKQYVNPKEAKIVVRMFELFASGLSAQSIARRFNEENLDSPGKHWKRKKRLNKDGSARKAKWRSTGIEQMLRNETYRGDYTWGKRHWLRDPGDSAIRVPELATDDGAVMEQRRPKLQIIEDALWNRVQKRLAARAQRGEAIRRGLANGNRGPGPWLGSGILICACGSNYTANGTHYMICSAVKDGACTSSGKQAVRFRRDVIDKQVFDLIERELLAPEVIAHEVRRFKAMIKDELAREPEQATKNDAVRDIDKQLENLRGLVKAKKLSADVAEPSIAALERQRREAVEGASGIRDKKLREALSRADLLPKLVEQYKALIRSALRFEDPKTVVEARDRVRSLIEDGTIVLTPTKDRTALTGEIRLSSLGRHFLRISNVSQNVNRSGSGGTIWSSQTARSPDPADFEPLGVAIPFKTARNPRDQSNLRRSTCPIASSRPAARARSFSDTDSWLGPARSAASASRRQTAKS